MLFYCFPLLAIEIRYAWFDLSLFVNAGFHIPSLIRRSDLDSTCFTNIKAFEGCFGLQ